MVDTKYNDGLQHFDNYLFEFEVDLVFRIVVQKDRQPFVKLTYR